MTTNPGLRPFIVECIEWNKAEDWLRERDRDGYEVIHIASEIYQGSSFFNIVMKLKKGEK